MIVNPRKLSRALLARYRNTPKEVLRLLAIDENEVP
jgi:hypothetical protein